MLFRESETIELKEIVVDTIKKEAIAFTNSSGGKLYVGVSDSGEIIGVDNPDDVIQKISNMLRDSIKPDITMFIHYETLEINKNQVVVVDIQRGTHRPYYLSKKGLRPEGVYVRQGTSSVPATDAAIRQMIKETDGDSFEEMRSIEQQLTFDITKKEFQKRNLALEQLQMQTLKILNADGIYTNLGLLLSEQCIHTIKVAVFEGTDQTVFKDRREFTGSLLQQLNEVYDYIDMHNQIHATFDKLLRIDTRDYPEIAVREALLNLLVHRDYSFRASTLISIYADRIEMVSVGGLIPGIELNDIMMGLSICRNPQLANVFYRLQLIEAYGTGMKKIIGAYTTTCKKTIIESSGNAFRIILPNLNFQSVPEKKNALPPINNEEKLLAFLQENSVITRIEVEKLLEVGTATAFRLLKSMVDKGILLQEGKGKNTKYIYIK